MTERKTLRATPAMRETLGIEPQPTPAPPAPVPPVPQPPAPAPSNKAERRREAYLCTRDLLRVRYPAIFGAA
ncbi:MAG TPA: hypothetical protein VFD73_11645, partial [Gemmatimonadales bacterium]|nr:hypothetical protein [Gemmatimonadales bacterium]